MKPTVICAGLIAVDLVFDVTGFPAKGSKNRAAGSRMITGGGALNAASAIAAMGGQACLAGAIGNDTFGAFLREKFTRRGIDHRFVTELDDVPTSRSANLITPDGDRTIINHREAALVPPAFTLPTDFAFDAVLVDTRWPDGAAHLVEAARSTGKPAVIDAEAPVAQAETALAAATHIVFSEQGLEDYCGDATPAALETVARRLGTWCAVTRGADPVLCHDGHTLSEIPAFPTRAINTLGAGDTWHAAFTLALAKGLPEPDAVRWASAAASLMVSRPPTESSLPSAAEIEAVLKS